MNAAEDIRQSDAIREILAIVDDRAARGIQTTEFCRVFNGYHEFRHMRIGTSDSPTGYCYRKEEIPHSSGKWLVFARFDTLDVLAWCLRALAERSKSKSQKTLFS